MELVFVDEPARTPEELQRQSVRQLAADVKVPLEDGWEIVLGQWTTERWR